VSIDLKALTRSALATLFGLGTDFVKDGTYVRPASFNPQTGLTVSAEQTAAMKMLLANYHPREVSLLALQPGDEKALVRASELVAISSPAAGDYLIQASDGQRRDVLSAVLDRTGELFVLQTQRSLHQDWGDLTAFTVSEDWGDFGDATELDDWGTLV
jgi:hypothetical protein